MTIIRKYSLLALGVALLIGALLVSALIRSVEAQSNAGGTSRSNQGGLTNGTNSGQGSGNMMGSGGMMGQGSGAMMGGGGAGMMSDVDRHFIEQMIPHHQTAVEMADLALQRAQRPELKALAADVKRTQTSEIEQMRAWYKSWYGIDVPAETSQDNHSDDMTGMMSNMGGGMMGMMGGSTGMMGCDMGDNSESSMNALANAADFDKTFIEQMTPHHRMAVMMSGMALTNGEKPELQDLARSIINSQSAEIQKMRDWRQTWYGSANQQP